MRLTIFSDKIPADIHRAIFDQLDRWDLESCLKVCKLWYKIIRGEQEYYLRRLQEVELKGAYLDRICRPENFRFTDMLMVGFSEKRSPKKYYLRWEKSGVVDRII